MIVRSHTMWLDTFLEPPDDICLFSDAPPVAGSSYLVHPRSIVALVRVAEGQVRQAPSGRSQRYSRSPMDSTTSFKSH